MSDRPSVLFVCVKNGGKSQMAAGLMRNTTGDAVEVSSAGTHPGDKINPLSADSLLELGIDITDEQTRRLTDDMVAAADRVIVLGRDAHVEPVGGTPIEIWDTDEPSERGIDGIQRMRLIRDDIAARVQLLAADMLELTAAPEGLRRSTSRLDLEQHSGLRLRPAGERLRGTDGPGDQDGDQSSPRGGDSQSVDRGTMCG